MQKITMQMVFFNKYSDVIVHSTSMFWLVKESWNQSCCQIRKYTDMLQNNVKDRFVIRFSTCYHTKVPFSCSLSLCESFFLGVSSFFLGELIFSSSTGKMLFSFVSPSFGSSFSSIIASPFCFFFIFVALAVFENVF